MLDLVVHLTESQNKSLESHSEGSSNPTPGPAQDHPQESLHAPESTVQTLLELIQTCCCGSYMFFMTSIST